MNPLRWLFNRTETRSHVAGVTQVYIDGKRRSAHSEGSAALSATLATCTGMWSRAFAMLMPDPSDALTPDHLAAIGQDLFLRGQSVFHIRLQGSDITLHRAAFWDQYSGGRWNLTIPHPNGTDTVRALDDEVLSLRINASPDAPWQGRSPLSFMGLSPSLMADVESAISGALPYAGKGLLPVPATVPEEQSTKAIQGLRNGSLAVVTSKEDFGHHTGGTRSELKRVELTPDLSRMGLAEISRDVHERVLSAAGIPPSLLTASGNAGAMREAYRLFALQTVDPLARMITPELKRKIGVERLGLQDMMSADVAGRARAVGALTAAGVPLGLALSMTGWDGIPLPEGASKPIAHGGE